MAVRIPWDKYEVALLIESFWRVKNQEEARPVVLENLSKALRQYAINRNVKIDDQYRNYNGMSIQMEAISLLFFPRAGVELNSASLFKVMVAMYNTEPNEYQAILIEAHRLIKTEQTIVVDIKKSFTEWLKDSIESKKYSIESIIACFDETSIYAIKHGISKKAFWDIINAKEFNEIRTKLSQNRIFKISHPRTFLLFENTGKYYSVFLKNNYALESVLPVVELTETPQPSPIPSDSKVIATKISSENDDTNQNRVDFECNNADYSFSKPTLISMFGLSNNIKYWAEAYVFVINSLLRERAIEIGKYIKEEIANVDIRPLFSTVSENLVSPKLLMDGNYVETNFSATNTTKLIRQACDACGVLAKTEIVIEFVRRENKANVQSKVAIPTKNKTVVSDFYDWLLHETHLGESTCRSYSSAINVISDWVVTNQITSLVLSSLRNVDSILDVINAILASPDFSQYNAEQHNRFSSALSKYLDFVRSTMLSDYKPFAVEDIDDLDAYRDILSERFPYGFIIESPIELLRFKRFYEEKTGNVCELNDENISLVIKYVGFEFSKKVYLISTETYDRIKRTIENELLNGNTILYYDCLFEVNESWLYDGRVISSDMLKKILMSLFPAMQHRQSYVILDENKGTELSLLKNELLRVWGDNSLQSFDDLSHKLMYVPIDKIKYALAQDDWFVWNSQEVYTHIGMFRIEAEQLQELQSFAKEECLSDGTVLLSELPLQSVQMNNPELSETALFNAVYYVAFKEEYHKNRRALSLKDSGSTAHQEMVKYCKGREICTLQELFDLWTEKTGTYGHSKPITVGCENMVRIDENTFVCDSKVHFDVINIDATIRNIIRGDFIGMKEITTFVAFPYCGFTWNLYLLESYCRRFSKLYRYDALVANSKNVGAIIKQTCKLKYSEIMEQAVALSGVRLEKLAVIDFLNDAGYLGKHSYSDIEGLIKRAANIRARR